MDIDTLKTRFVLVVVFVIIGCFSIFSVIKAQVSVDEISFGQESVFNTASTSYGAINVLSSNKVVAVYQDGGGNFNTGAAAVGEISNDNIIFSSEYVFNDTAVNSISSVSISEGGFIVAYSDEGNYNYGTVRIGNTSNDIINFGPEYVFNTANTDCISIILLSPNKFVVTYKDVSSFSGVAIVGNISDNNISFGPEFIFNTAPTNYISAVFLSESKFAVAYQDGGNLNYGMAIIGDVSDNNIDFGSEFIFSNANADFISADTLSTDKIIIAYRGGGAYFNYGMAIIGDVSGKSVSFGPESIFNKAATSYISVISLSKNKLAIAYQNKNLLDYGVAIIGEVSGNTIVFNLESESIFNENVTRCNYISQLMENSFAIAYQSRNGNTNYGNVVIGSILADEVAVIEEETDEKEETIREKTAVETVTETETIITDGDLVRNPNAEGVAQFDIYIAKIVGSKKFKRLILSPHVFESYAHFDKNGNGSPWDDVQDVNQTTMDAYATSDLVRADGDTKVYQLMADGDAGIRRLLSATDNDFPKYYDRNSIYTINSVDMNAYNNT